MIIPYLVGSVLIAGTLFLNTNRFVNKLLVIAFMILQWAFTLFEVFHKGMVEYSYFLPDALALLLLITVSIICIPAMAHSYDYVYTEQDNNFFKLCCTKASITP